MIDIDWQNISWRTLRLAIARTYSMSNRQAGRYLGEHFNDQSMRIAIAPAVREIIAEEYEREQEGLMEEQERLRDYIETGEYYDEAMRLEALHKRLVALQPRVARAIARNRSTGGSLWRALKEADEDGDVEEIERLLRIAEAAERRHGTTDYEARLAHMDRETARTTAVPLWDNLHTVSCSNEYWQKERK